MSNYVNEQTELPTLHQAKNLGEKRFPRLGRRFPAHANGVLGYVFCALLSGVVWADKGDRTRPIQIEADSLRMDDARKTAVYEGNVVLTQGTMVITADRLDVRQDNKGMTEGEATGQPVTFRQKLDGRETFLEARANRVEYDARTDTMRLIGNAFVAQGNDELRGGLITYDLRTERYQAQGGLADGKQGRVRARIQPRNQPEAVEPEPVKENSPAKP